MNDVLVLGAGPAGLMAALEVARSGRACTVLEASDHVGGMAASTVVGGQRVDLGSHRLHPATPPRLLGQIRDLLGADLQVRPRSGRIRFGDNWVGFPLRATDLARSMPPTVTARLAGETAAASLRAAMPGAQGAALSFDAEIRSRFGRTVAERFYGPYARKLYGVDPSDLDVELARRRVSAKSPTAIVGRLLRAARPSGRTFLYPRRGYGQISEALAEAAVVAGARIELQHPVTEVTVSGDGVSVITGRREQAEPTWFSAQVALSTLPVGRLARMLTPAPPGEMLSALDELQTRALVLVYLVLDQPRYTAFDAHYMPGLDTVTARLSEPKNYRDGDDPADTTVLCAEIACWPGDEIWRAEAEHLAELVIDDLARLGLPEVRPVHTEVRRLSSVYPVLECSTAQARAVVDAWTHTPGRVLTLGRQGLQVMDNLHHVLDMGAAAAASLAIDPDSGHAVDASLWSDHLSTFGSHTVED